MLRKETQRRKEQAGRNELVGGGIKVQPGKVANPAPGQLNRKNKYFPVPVRAYEFGLARQVRLSRLASACPFSTLRLNLMLTQGIPPDFRGGVHLFIPPSAIG